MYMCRKECELCMCVGRGVSVYMSIGKVNCVHVCSMCTCEGCELCTCV